MWRGAGGSVPNPMPSGLTIPSPTITGTASGVPTIIHTGGPPLIYLSSGSVAANGAISGITALPVAYAHAYCRFPANALATTIAAGWHYCTFSTTTAGVAYLDTYTSGVPTIPASPAAVTDGKGAFTSGTGEVTAYQITVPALGVASSLRIALPTASTNNANSKLARARISGGAGTAFGVVTATSTAAAGGVFVISNVGSASAQVSAAVGSPSTPVAGNFLGAVNTAVSTTLALTMDKATATDNFIILPPQVEVLYVVAG